MTSQKQRKPGRIKKCPFCGLRPKWDIVDGTHARLHCLPDCPTRPSTPYCIIDYFPFDAKPKNLAEAKAAAILIWNTRAP